MVWNAKGLKSAAGKNSAAVQLKTWPVGIRDEIILGIPMGPVCPMGFPWEWKSLY